MLIVWGEREAGTLAAFADGRYSGWVQPAPIPGMWLANWRLSDTELEGCWPRLWAYPLGEEPGHLWPPVDDARALGAS